MSQFALWSHVLDLDKPAATGSEDDSPMSAPDSPITQWIAELKQGDAEAARQLWGAYFERVRQAARRRLGTAPARVADEEDAALSVFRSLFEGAAAGRFQELTDRQDLWMLLMAMTRHKSVDEIRRRTRRKRGGGEVRGESAFAAGPGKSSAFGLREMAGDDPTPDTIVAAEEQLRHLLSLLRDDDLRRVAQRRLEGRTNAEIAEELGVVERSVERKLRLIRDTWESELNDG